MGSLSSVQVMWFQTVQAHLRFKGHIEFIDDKFSVDFFIILLLKIIFF